MRKTRVLIVGDSITRGLAGVNFIRLLDNDKDLKNYQFINWGLGGDTLVGIGNRLLKEIKKNDYDIIVISAGHNDIIIPEMKHLDLCKKIVAGYLIKRGSIPTETDEFYDVYAKLIDDVRMICNSKIILSTISCISEDLNATTNSKREVINRIIRKVALNKNCLVTEVDKYFDEILKNTDNKYFLGKCLNSYFFDLLKSITVKGAMRLSNKRRLQLTIDGVHLNLQGALIYKEAIKNYLVSLSPMRK